MTPPNVLLFMTDQFHADCLGAIRPEVRTPHLDRLAAGGMRFDRAYCPTPICAPTRACLMRGQYPHTTRIEGNEIFELDVPATDTLPETLRRAGYRTGLVGKAHLPKTWIDAFEYVRLTDLADSPPGDPTQCHYFQYLIDRDLASFYEEGTARPGAPEPDDGSQPSELPCEHSIERYTGDRAVEFLRDQPDDFRPFFLKVSFQRPHGPIRPSRRHFDLYDPETIPLPPSAADWFERHFAGKPQLLRDILGEECSYPLATKDPAVLRRLLASYYALITAIDEEIGRVLDALDALGQTDNTLVLFTTDHGDFAGEHGLFHKNLGIYESIHRVPLLLRKPGGPAGLVHDGIVETIDLYPTICDFLGVQPPADLEGVSLLGFLDDPGRCKGEALCQWSRFDPRRILALRTRRHRLVYYGNEHGGELYDHDTDPHEMNNLWDHPDHADIRRELVEQLLSRMMCYRGVCEIPDDRVLAEQMRYTPRFALHKKQADWNRILKGLRPAPAPRRDD